MFSVVMKDRTLLVPLILMGLGVAFAAFAIGELSEASPARTQDFFLRHPDYSGSITPRNPEALPFWILGGSLFLVTATVSWLNRARPRLMVPIAIFGASLSLVLLIGANSFDASLEDIASDTREVGGAIDLSTTAIAALTGWSVAVLLLAVLSSHSALARTLYATAWLVGILFILVGPGRAVFGSAGVAELSPEPIGAEQQARIIEEFQDRFGKPLETGARLSILPGQQLLITESVTAYTFPPPPELPLLDLHAGNITRLIVSTASEYANGSWRLDDRRNLDVGPDIDLDDRRLEFVTAETNDLTSSEDPHRLSDALLISQGMDNGYP